MAKVTLPYNFTPRDYQIPIFAAFDSGYRRLVSIWHRRAGKEKTYINLVAREMQKRIGLYLYIFPTYTQGKKAVWDGKDKEGFPFISHFPNALIASKNKTELKIEYKNGSIFQIVGAENVDSLLSTNPIGVVFAEYSLQDPSAWEFIRPILLENGGWAAFDYTPRGKNHGYTLYEMASNNPDWYVSKLSVNDTKKSDGTPVITPEMIDSERREGVSEEMIQQEYYVSFEGVQEGSYYGKQLAEVRAEGRIGRIPYDQSVGVETWWDIGMGDSTAIWFTQTIGREIHVIDYMENSGEAIAFYAKEMQKKPYVYKAHHGPHDLEVREFGNGGKDGRPLTRRETAKSLGIDFQIVPNIPVDDGINAVRAFLANCWFDADKCARGLLALAEYHKDWDEKNKVFRSYPAHNWASHGADGFRYLAVGHKNTLAKPKPKRGGSTASSGTYMGN